MGRVVNTLHELTPAITQVIVQAALAGVNVVYKLAASNGMSLRILIAYRFIFASAFIIPIALIVERKNRPKLTWLTIGQAFICGFLGGSFFQNLYAVSLVMTSATFVSAIYNTIPAMTFVLAVLFKLEQLKLKTIAGKAKVVGTLTCMGGAMILIFYKGGLEINIWSTKIDILKHGHVATHHDFSNPIVGSLLALCFCFSFAMNLIIQAWMMRSYPCPYSAAAMTLSMGGVQSTIYALCVDRDWDSWKLGWNVNLLSASYMGIMGSAVAFTLMTWCVRARGALYVSIFNPLMLILVAIFGSLLLDEKLHIGSVLGSGIIICGLYTVLWGISRQRNKSPIHDVVKDPEKQNTIDKEKRSQSSILRIPSISDEVKIDINQGTAKNEDCTITNVADVPSGLVVMSVTRQHDGN